jgi:hypothetical protein
MPDREFDVRQLAMADRHIERAEEILRTRSWTSINCGSRATMFSFSSGRLKSSKMVFVQRTNTATS